MAFYAMMHGAVPDSMNLQYSHACNAPVLQVRHAQQPSADETLCRGTIKQSSESIYPSEVVQQLARATNSL